MLRKFASLAKPAEMGFAYDSESFDSRAPIESNFRAFQTYGDGLCQHSGDWAVTVEQLGDYLASLAVAMLADEDLVNGVAYTLTHRPSVKEIEFCAGVVYKEGKTRYYSVKEQVISASPAKEHDKRYFRIEPRHDGSAEAIYSMLIPEYADGMMRYCFASAIRDWTLAENNRPYTGLPGEFLKWNDRDAARQLRNAYEACYSLVEAYQLRSRAETAIENYKRMLPKPEASETGVQS